MKATELRIGNWVDQPNEGVAKVTSILNNLQIRTETGYVDKYCKSIPLTEEWLLKFGFKRNDNTKGWSDSFYWIMGGGSELHINPDNGVVWIHRNENIFNNPCLVKHLHQLQNLYFALTGEELDIK
jgi:hypothetical protein